jgi:hypothetical protein
VRGVVAALSIAAGACFEYSPHATDLDGSERGLHQKALARLDVAPAPAFTRFAVVGDTQLRADDTADAVDHLNARTDVAFVVQIGDFTHLGLLPEFKLMNDVFARLRVPYFVVIGIHEYLGNGEEIYASMFGPHDLAFTLQGTRFVLFDDNSREFAFDGTVPDVAWLARQLPADGSYHHAVLFSHVPPGTSDFDPALVERYDALLEAQPDVISFHGHEEKFRFEERRGTPVYVVDGINGRSYFVVTVLAQGGFEIERVSF